MDNKINDFEEVFKTESKPRKYSEIETHFVREKVAEELVEYAKEKGLPSLADRVRRGFDPIGIVANSELREKSKIIAEKMDIDFAELEEICIQIQKGGVWEFVLDFNSGENKVVNTWIILNAANLISRGEYWERERDMTGDDFMKHYDDLRKQLDKAGQNPENYLNMAREVVVEDAKSMLTYDEDVPISENDIGFLAMAIEGHQSGVLKSSDGNLFVGARNIDDSILENWGLQKQYKEDRGRKNVEFWYNKQGDALLKRLYPGFAIIISRNMDLAKAIVRSIENKEHIPSEKAFGHIMYQPTSAKEEDDSSRVDIISDIVKPVMKYESESKIESTELVNRRQFNENKFYEGIFDIKAKTVFIEIMEEKRKDRAKRGKGVKASEIRKICKRSFEKQKQKIDELKYLIEVIDHEIGDLPENVNVILDMAGGSGDLALALASYFKREGRELEEARVIDPFSERLGLDKFMDMIIDHLPFADELHDQVIQTNQSIQEVEIPNNSIVVAKHSCGTLTDDIIEKWTYSESPMLVIMTCCHNKAAGEPPRYNMSQDEWDNLCKDTGGVKRPDKPEMLEKGKEALRFLDIKRVEYFSKHQFDEYVIEAKLFKNDNFPMGDVIVAKKKPRF